MAALRKALRCCGAVLLLSVVVSGCGKEGRDVIVSSVGSYGDIALVVSDPNLRAGADEVLARMNPVRTFVLKREATFRFHHFPANKWKNARNYRNLLYVVRWGDGGPLQKEVGSLISDATLDRLVGGGGGIVFLENPYFQNQLLIVAVCTDRNGLISLLNSKQDEVRGLFTEHNDRRMIGDARLRGIHDEARERYRSNFGFSFEIPVTYRENQVRPGGFDGVEWIRNDPTRGFSVAWRSVPDPTAALADRELLADLRRELGAKLHDEELFDATFVWSDTELAGLPAVMLEGSWSSNKVDVGGAFWSYFVPDRVNGRIFCIDLLVYAPDRPKMDFFRRMRAVAQTFSLDRQAR